MNTEEIREAARASAATMPRIPDEVWDQIVVLFAPARDPRNEKLRRNYAQAHRDDFEVDSAVAIKPKRLGRVA